VTITRVSAQENPQDLGLVGLLCIKMYFMKDISRTLANVSFFFLLVGPGFELRASLLQSRRITTSHFALVILEIGSRELFACPGLDL
jgi:hypothetical protein